MGRYGIPGFVFLAILGLSLVRSPRLPGTRETAPRDTSTIPLGSIDLSPRSHLFVRGHELTGTVTAMYRGGTVTLNDVVWWEEFTPQRAAGRLQELERYMTWSGTSLAIYTSYGTMLSVSGDAERGLDEIRRLEAAGWHLDRVKPGRLSEGFLLEIAQEHGYRPRPPRVETTLVTFPPAGSGLLRPRWQLLTPWHHLNTPAVVDTSVYIMARHGELSVLDVRTGRELRTASTSQHGMLDNSVRDEKYLYVTPGNNRMTALNLDNERPAWSRLMEEIRESHGCGMKMSWMTTRPALGEGRLYFASQNGKVYAIDRKTGWKRWTRDMGDPISAPPAFHNGIVYVGGAGMELAALSARSGKIRWTCPLGETIEYGSPVVAENTVYVAGRDGTVFAVDAELGVLRWSTKIGKRFRGDVTMAKNVLCAADVSGIYGLDPSDGHVVWTVPEAANNPVFAAGLIFCVTSAGDLLAMEPHNGHIVERLNVAGRCLFSRPLIQDGCVFVAAASDTAGSLMCFDLSAQHTGSD